MLLPTTMTGAAVANVGTGALRVDVTVPTTSSVCVSVVCKATKVVEEPLPSVMEDPGTSVCPETTNSDAEFALIVLLPTTMTGGVAEVVGAATFRIEVVLPPTTTTVCELVVCSATTVLDEPEPTVIEEPGARVCPDTMNCEAELTVTVLLPTIIAGVLDVGGGAWVATSCVLDPTMTKVWLPDVMTAMGVVPIDAVCPCVMVCEPMTTAGTVVPLVVIRTGCGTTVEEPMVTGISCTLAVEGPPVCALVPEVVGANEKAG